MQFNNLNARILGEELHRLGFHVGQVVDETEYEPGFVILTPVLSVRVYENSCQVIIRTHAGEVDYPLSYNIPALSNSIRQASEQLSPTSNEQKVNYAL